MTHKEIQLHNINRNKAHTPNSTYKKVAVQWLKEALCPDNRDSVVADSLVLRNRQLLVAAKRYVQPQNDRQC